MKSETDNQQQSAPQPQPQFQNPQWGGSRMWFSSHLLCFTINNHLPNSGRHPDRPSTPATVSTPRVNKLPNCETLVVVKHSDTGLNRIINSPVTTQQELTPTTISLPLIHLNNSLLVQSPDKTLHRIVVLILPMWRR